MTEYELDWPPEDLTEARKRWIRIRKDCGLPYLYGETCGKYGDVNPNMGYIGGYYHGFYGNPQNTLQSGNQEYRKAWMMGWEDGRADWWYWGGWSCRQSDF